MYHQCLDIRYMRYSWCFNKKAFCSHFCSILNITYRFSTFRCKYIQRASVQTFINIIHHNFSHYSGLTYMVRYLQRSIYEFREKKKEFTINIIYLISSNILKVGKYRFTKFHKKRVMIKFHLQSNQIDTILLDMYTSRIDLTTE